MRILYITELPGLVSAGPSWSVPASIRAQSKIDECLWVNVCDGHLEHWNEVGCYHNIKDFGDKFCLENLPAPFNHPDLVVFEDFYEMQPPLIAMQIRKAGVPYIIVPRGALTKKAQNNGSKWKKKIANALLFNNYVRKALAIQFLTKAELNDTGDGWNKKNFILPNGFTTPDVFRDSFSDKAINATFIGRLDVYHKGIDVLLDACRDIADDLREVNFKLCIYGPKNTDYDIIDGLIKQYNLSDMISLGGETSGKDKEDVLLNTDLFVLTSRFEGHPMGLVEALAYGVPAMVTPGTNMAEEIEHADAGWVCNGTTKGEITDMLKCVIAEKMQLAAKGRNAREMAKQYDWDKLAERFHKEINLLLSSNA